MPPRPNITIGPKWGSQKSPANEFAPADDHGLDQKTIEVVTGRVCNSRSRQPEPLRDSGDSGAQPPRSVLCVNFAPSPLRTTGNPISLAFDNASSGVMGNGLFNDGEYRIDSVPLSDSASVRAPPPPAFTFAMTAPISISPLLQSIFRRIFYLFFIIGPSRLQLSITFTEFFLTCHRVCLQSDPPSQTSVIPCEKFFLEVYRSMPELPEVETLCRQLKLVVVAEKILNVEVLDTKLGNPPDLSGRNRQNRPPPGQVPGKSCLIPGWSLRLHLRMSGKAPLANAPIGSPCPTHASSSVLKRGFSCSPIPAAFRHPVGLFRHRRGRLAAFSVLRQGSSGNKGLRRQTPHCRKGFSNGPERDRRHRQYLRLRDSAPGRHRSFCLHMRHLRRPVAKDRQCRVRHPQTRDPRPRHNRPPIGEIYSGSKGNTKNQLEVYAREGLPCNRCGATGPPGNPLRSGNLLLSFLSKMTTKPTHFSREGI